MRRPGTTVASLHRVDQQPDVDELVGEQRLVVVVEDGAQLHRAGGRVDLVVDGVELADAELVLLRAVEHASPGSLAPAFSRSRTGGSLSSGMVKITEIGCTWVITPMPVASLVVHVVAGIDQAQADAAGDRRDDAV